jgi:hypothetical protein
MSERPLTVLFMPCCAAVATGVVFAAEASWRGALTRSGSPKTSSIWRPSEHAAAGQDAGQFWKDFIREVTAT